MGSACGPIRGGGRGLRRLTARYSDATNVVTRPSVTRLDQTGQRPSLLGSALIGIAWAIPCLPWEEAAHPVQAARPDGNEQDRLGDRNSAHLGQ